MRVLGIDLGARRIGLAVSDSSRTLARPLMTLTVARQGRHDQSRDDDGTAEAVEVVLQQVARLAAEDDGLSTIVVGVPVRLDGSRSDQTDRAEAFIKALAARTPIPIVAEGEQLSSREAESRLAVNERDWRKRKLRIDAAAAAVILQDFLDRRA
jgi:putative holliday junction resolvase